MAEDVSPRPAANEPVHLGDGVYATFDGYHIWLGANDPRNRAVALEPAVFNQLYAYARRVWAPR